MITLRDFMTATDYRITEGSDYGWQCYGPNAYDLTAWNGDQQGWGMNIIFDTQTQTVYEAGACDYLRGRAYRRINPDYVIAYQSEAQERGTAANLAWEDVNYVDLETDRDFLEKAQAMVQGRDYDTRVEIELTVPDEVLFEVMKLAHQQDQTLNQFVEQVMRDALDQDILADIAKERS